MTAAFVLGQNVNLAGELGVGVNALRSSQNLATLDVLLRNAAEQAADVVASLGVLEGLVEHLGAGNGGLDGVLDADDLNLIANLDGATLDTAGNDGAAAGDGEHVLDGHQERLVSGAVRGLDPGVNSVHQLPNALVFRSMGILGLGNQSVQSGALDDRGVVARELVGIEQLADFHFDELKQLGVVNLVNLVQEDEDVRNVNLAGQQQVLAGLRHRAVGSSDHEDAAVHLSSAGDHVLDIVGVTRAVNVRIVTALNLLAVQSDTVVGLILNVSGVDRDAAGLLFRSLVDLVVSGELSRVRIAQGQNLGDRSSQGSLAMVNVTNGADIDMGLASVKHLLCHKNILLIFQNVQMLLTFKAQRAGCADQLPLCTIFSCSDFGSSTKWLGSMLYVARPCVLLRRSVA